MAIDNIMLDLETMATTPNAAIVAIGAVRFDADFGISDKFYKVIDLESSMKKGFDVDASTIKWWMKQSETARKEIYGEGLNIKEVLASFRDWVGDGNTRIWGNGVDFDNVITRNAFAQFGVKNPWDYRLNRCFRTVRGSFPEVEVPKVGTAHNAVDDAEYQARYLLALTEKHNLKNMI